MKGMLDDAYEDGKSSMEHIQAGVPLEYWTEMSSSGEQQAHNIFFWTLLVGDTIRTFSLIIMQTVKRVLGRNVDP